MENSPPFLCFWCARPRRKYSALRMARPRDPERQIPRPFPRFGGRLRPPGRASIAFNRAWWACRQLCGWVLLPPLLKARSRGLFGHHWPKIEISCCFAMPAAPSLKRLPRFGRIGRTPPAGAAVLLPRYSPRGLRAAAPRCRRSIMRRSAPPALWGASVWGLGSFPPLMPPPKGLRQ